MGRSIEINDEIYEGESYRTLAHIVGLDDTSIVTGDLDDTEGNAVWMQVFDMNSSTPDTPLASYAETAVVPASFVGLGGTSGLTWTAISIFNDVDASSLTTPLGVIYDTLQTGVGWPDATGFNFMHNYHFTNDLGARVAVEGGQHIRLEYTLNATKGSPSHGIAHVVVKLKILPLYGV